MSKAYQYPKVKIRLDRARPGEENFEIVAVNTETYQIMKGVDVEVPYEVYAILRDQQADLLKSDSFLETKSTLIK